MPDQAFIVISVQQGPLEGGLTYRSMWVQPTEWEDRAAPHLTRGPVPMKIDCSDEAINFILQSGQSLPSPFSLDIGVKVAGGNKSKGYVFSAKLHQANSAEDKTQLKSLSSMAKVNNG
jgi:hypothetical protein